jgi:hypothetical protein
MKNGLFHLCQLLILLLITTPLLAAPTNCSYQSYQWSTIEKRAVNRHTVSHPYYQLTTEEIDPVTGCSVCREDQIELTLPGLAPFQVCKILSASIEEALLDLIAAGEPIEQVIGYRVGKTRGKPDEQGLRTAFSNHSYGVAIDINPQHNGLYDHCIHYGPECRLIRGGKWQPHNQHFSLNPDGPVVSRFKQEGFRWGGEIPGKQKDFMHFSPSGY